jgi:hypothetical protein
MTKESPGILQACAIAQPAFPTFIVAACEIHEVNGAPNTFAAEIIPVLGIQSYATHFDDATHEDENAIIDIEGSLDYVVIQDRILTRWPLTDNYRFALWSVVVLPPQLCSPEQAKSILNEEAQILIAALKQGDKHGSDRTRCGQNSWIEEHVAPEAAVTA